MTHSFHNFARHLSSQGVARVRQEKRGRGARYKDLTLYFSSQPSLREVRARLIQNLTQDLNLKSSSLGLDKRREAARLLGPGRLHDAERVAVLGVDVGRARNRGVFLAPAQALWSSQTLHEHYLHAAQLLRLNNITVGFACLLSVHA